MKNRFVAAFFAFMFPALGINEFYLGNNSLGIIEVLVSVLFCWTGIVPLVVAVINIVKGCQYLWCDSNEEFVSKFITSK